MNDHGEVFYWHFEANVSTYDKPPEFPAHDPESEWVRLLHKEPRSACTYYDYKNPAANVFYANLLRDRSNLKVKDETVWATQWATDVGFGRTAHRWEEHYDEVSAKVFYVHASSRQVSWEPPPGASEDFFFLHHLKQK